MDTREGGWKKDSLNDFALSASQRVKSLRLSFFLTAGQVAYHPSVCDLLHLLEVTEHLQVCPECTKFDS